MSLGLLTDLLFPAGRAFIPFPVRRGLLRLLERDTALTEKVRREPANPATPPRAWVLRDQQSWRQLQSALIHDRPVHSADDWLATHGPLESPAEEAFVREVAAPVLKGALRLLVAQESFALPSGTIGRIDFTLHLSEQPIAVEIDGLRHHEGPGPDGRRPERERDRQNALVGAGYTLLRYTAREVLQAPASVRRKFEADLRRLDLHQGYTPVDGPILDIEPESAALLAHWPRRFVQAQQTIVGHLSCEGVEWGYAERRTILLPHNSGGASALGVLDALEALCIARVLEGSRERLRRLTLWVGEDLAATRRILKERSHALPFALSIITGDLPPQADLLLIPAEGDELDDASLVSLLEPLGDTGLVVWASAVDGAFTLPDGEPPRPLRGLSEPWIARLLERFFGFSAFRTGQWPIVENLLRGNGVLGVLPTGAGKTVCFQLPAMLRPGITIVVSPLVSLMDDQVMNLRSVGLDFAGRVHSNLSDDERADELRRFSAGQYKLFYISPERFHSRSFLDELRSRLEKDGLRIEHFVVDEAHLASEWGHGFRPSYLTLPHAHRSLCPEAPLALLTATAPRPIREDLLQLFAEQEIEQLLPATFDRPELSFEAHEVRDDEHRLELLASLLKERLPQSLGASGFSDLHQLNRDTDQVRHGGLVFTPWGKPGNNRHPIRASVLSEALSAQGLSAVSFFSGDGRGPFNRHTQERFKRNEIPLVVATKGFGTGVDKPDIRYVVHADLPGSLESLYQEAGRAGRDREDARAVVLWRRRPSACSTERQAPSCVSSKRCPFGLTELCSFGIQARLRALTQPGSTAEIETSISLWRRFFTSAIEKNEREVIVPRKVRPDDDPRPEILEHTERFLQRLYQLGLCGAPWSPGPEREFFVANRPLDRGELASRLHVLRPGASLPSASSDELLIARCLQLAYGLDEQEAHNNTAVWVTYLRRRQYITDKKSPVPRPGARVFGDKVTPDVERFLARLLSLQVITDYHYHLGNAWAVTLSDPQTWQSQILQRRLGTLLQRYKSTGSPGRLPPLWSEAVERAVSAVINSWYESIAVRSWESLENLEEFVSASDCRRQRIAQYMNEGAVSIPSPCGHCDNCGIRPYTLTAPRTVNELVQEQIARFNKRLHRLERRPRDLDSVEGVLDEARDNGLLSAVRDTAARQLERTPTTASLRLAAAIATHELGEEGVSGRHVRTLLRQCADAGDQGLLVQLLNQALPKTLLASIVDVLPTLLASLPARTRTLLQYRALRRLDEPRAIPLLADMLREAAARLPSEESS